MARCDGLIYVDASARTLAAIRFVYGNVEGRLHSLSLTYPYEHSYSLFETHVPLVAVGRACIQISCTLFRISFGMRYEDGAPKGIYFFSM